MPQQRKRRYLKCDICGQAHGPTTQCKSVLKVLGIPGRRATPQCLIRVLARRRRELRRFLDLETLNRTGGLGPHRDPW